MTTTSIMSSSLFIILLFIHHCASCPTGFAVCASLDSLCVAPGVVAMGSTTNSRYTFQESIEHSIQCSSTVFGDPAPGYTKQCCYQAPPLTGPVTPIVNTISCGETRKSMFKDNDDKHYWQLTTNNLKDITYTTCESSFDTRVHIYNDKGEIFSVPYCPAPPTASNQNKTGDDCNEDQCTFNNNELFTIPSQIAGTYYIEIISYDNNVNGNYQLQVTCNNIPITFQHLGCYKDMENNRSMYKDFGSPYTIEECYNLCIGYKYFAIEDGDECGCDDSYGSATKHGTSIDCGTCGNSNCEKPGTGGVWSFDLYERPTLSPTSAPTQNPTPAPTDNPTAAPTNNPTLPPTPAPTDDPTAAPSLNPSISPTAAPTNNPTNAPSLNPSISPTAAPTDNPTNAPSLNPSISPSVSPSQPPTISPSSSPSYLPSNAPSYSPSNTPSFSPTIAPSKAPTTPPTKGLSVGDRESTTSIDITSTRDNNGINGTPQRKREDSDDFVGSLSIIVIIASVTSIICCCGFVIFLICFKRKQEGNVQQEEVKSVEGERDISMDANINSNIKAIEMEQIQTNVVAANDIFKVYSVSSKETPYLTQQQQQQPMDDANTNRNHIQCYYDDEDGEEDDDDLNEMYENHDTEQENDGAVTDNTTGGFTGNCNTSGE